MFRFGETNDGCNQGLFAGHTRYALCEFWTHWTRRALVLFLGLALLLGLLPSRALAYPNRQEVILSDQVATIGDDRGVGYMVIAYNAFNAALLALGYSATDSRLTNDVRAKLSNAATGGDFYVFSQSFKTQAQLLGDLPAWTFGARDFIDMWETSASSGTVGPYMDIFTVRYCQTCLLLRSAIWIPSLMAVTLAVVAALVTVILQLVTNRLRLGLVALKMEMFMIWWDSGLHTLIQRLHKDGICKASLAIFLV